MSNITAITPFALTAKGHALQLKVQAGLCKLELTGAKIGDGYLQEGQTIESLISLIHEIPTADGSVATQSPIATLAEVCNDTDSDGHGRVMIHVLIRNGNNESTRITECGILAKDTDGSTILYGAINLGDSSMAFERFNGTTPIVYNWKFPLYISSEADINMNYGFVAGVSREDFETHTNNTSNPHSVTAAQVGAIPIGDKGSAGGVAELDENGLIPSSQLPSYVDDVIECVNISAFPATGESGKIYVDKATNKTYRWSGTQYTEISVSLALGETAQTAYRGDRGKVAYDHSQAAHAPADAEPHRAPTTAEVLAAIEGQSPSLKRPTVDTLSTASVSGVAASTQFVRRALEAYDYTKITVTVTSTPVENSPFGQKTWSISSASGTWFFKRTNSITGDSITGRTCNDEGDSTIYLHGYTESGIAYIFLDVDLWSGRNGEDYDIIRVQSAGTYELILRKFTN